MVGRARSAAPTWERERAHDDIRTDGCRVTVLTTRLSPPNPKDTRTSALSPAWFVPRLFHPRSALEPSPLERGLNTNHSATRAMRVTSDPTAAGGNQPHHASRSYRVKG